MPGSRKRPQKTKVKAKAKVKVKGTKRPTVAARTIARLKASSPALPTPTTHDAVERLKQVAPAMPADVPSTQRNPRA